MSTVRLFVEQDLGPGLAVGLDAPQAHYVANVLRLAHGAEVRLFNGRDGEWRGTVETSRRGRCAVALAERTREQDAAPDLWLAFAPIKRARIDFVASKATELGVSRLVPVLTRHTAVERVNVARLRANAVEAAEQCGRLTVPDVADPVALDALVESWPDGRRLLVCDETGESPPIATALRDSGAPAPWAVLTGPEGGFARSELDLLRKLSIVTSVALGPRILRADTAAIAALACWQALIGDWRQGDPASGPARIS